MDATKPLISVVMSVHNGEQWLGQCMDSIIAQTYPHWEFIIIDDASSTAAQTILQQYAARDARIQIIRKDTQQGLTRNLNTAIDLCKGEFIARMDADDISRPERLAKQLAFLHTHPQAAMVASFIDLIDESGTITGEWKDDRKAGTSSAIRSMLPWRNCIAHPSVMIRAATLRQYRYRETQLHSQDWDLWLRMTADGQVIEKINEPLLLYRVHKTSVTSSTNRQSAFGKKQQTYRSYLAGSKGNGFNTKVRLAAMLNRVKLLLSQIKRALSR